MTGIWRVVLYVSLILIYVCAESLAEPSLDPEEGKYFLVSAVFELAGNLREGDKVNLLAKTVDFGRGPIGYGLGLRTFKTSIRPQVYWSAEEGDGGYFTFGDFPFRADRTYVLTVVGRAGEFLALYLQDRGRDLPSTKAAAVKFLGGHDLRGVRTPQNGGAISYKGASDSERSSKVKVYSLLVAVPEQLKDAPDKLSKFLDGGPEEISKKLKGSEIRLWELSTIGQ